MIITQHEPNITVPVSEGTVAEFVDAGNLPRQVILENTGLNTINYRFQYSADRVSWTDVTSNASLAPGAAIPVTVDRPESFVRLRADGNSTLAVTVSRRVAFSGTFTAVQA